MTDKDLLVSILSLIEKHFDITYIEDSPGTSYKKPKRSPQKTYKPTTKPTTKKRRK